MTDDDETDARLVFPRGERPYFPDAPPGYDDIDTDSGGAQRVRRFFAGVRQRVSNGLRAGVDGVTTAVWAFSMAVVYVPFDLMIRVALPLAEGAQDRATPRQQYFLNSLFSVNKTVLSAILGAAFATEVGDAGAPDPNTGILAQLQTPSALIAISVGFLVLISLAEAISDTQNQP